MENRTIVFVLGIAIGVLMYGFFGPIQSHWSVGRYSLTVVETAVYKTDTITGDVYYCNSGYFPVEACEWKPLK